MKLESNQFVHVEEISIYNNNYYKHKTHGYTIYEKCDDDTTFMYYMVIIENNTSIFLGYSFEELDPEANTIVELS